MSFKDGKDGIPKTKTAISKPDKPVPGKPSVATLKAKASKGDLKVKEEVAVGGGGLNLKWQDGATSLLEREEYKSNAFPEVTAADLKKYHDNLIREYMSKEWYKTDWEKNWPTVLKEKLRNRFKLEYEAKYDALLGECDRVKNLDYTQVIVRTPAHKGGKVKSDPEHITIDVVFNLKDEEGLLSQVGNLDWPCHVYTRRDPAKGVWLDRKNGVLLQEPK